MTIPAPKDFAGRSRQVVETFLQSVVVLDDRAYFQPPPEGPTEPLRSPAYDVLSGSSHESVDEVFSDVPLDAKAVIDGFADLGSVCAVLRPLPTEPYGPRVSKAAARSDIVVLDWKIADSYGEETLDVIRRILSEDEQSSRLRMMAIYTGEINLEEISEAVKKTVDEFYAEETLTTDGQFRIFKGPVLAVILAKESSTYEHMPALKGQVVSEAHLAGRLRDELAQAIGGILRNVALAGISHIRSNSHRILAKFNSELDPAYLGHRVLLSNSSDAEEHIVAALGSEIVSILEESGSEMQAGSDVIDDWLAAAVGNGLDLSSPFAFQSKDARRGWKELLSRDFNAPDMDLPEGGKRGLKKGVTKAFTREDQSAKRADHAFSALLSLKTRYPGRHPRLTIGTILSRREEGKRRYFLCLQPKCDSVRIDGKAGFPFLAMKVVQQKETDEPFRLVVETRRDEWEHLHIKPVPSELDIRSFEGGPNLAGEVRARPRFGGFYFRDSDGKNYRWIAEMKEEHAFQTAGDVAAALARPGPDNSEWLRLASQR